NHGWWRIATACLTVRSRIRAIAVAGNGHRASTIRAGLASGTRLDVTDATAIPVRERAGIELQPLDADLLDRAIAIAKRCRSDLHAHGIERAAAVVDVRRGVDAQFTGDAEQATVGNAVHRRKPGVLLRLQRAGVFQATLGGDHQPAGLRADGTGIAHAHAMLGADQG